MIANLGTEVLYSFIIIVCSLMIYFGTKEIYQLSKHKGVRYFRLTFLFFALAYFSRSFIKFIILYFNTPSIMNVPPKILSPFVGMLCLFLFIYFSTIAIFYLFYSLAWKKLDSNSNRTYLPHIISLLLAFTVIFFNNSIYYLLLNLILFTVILITAFLSKRKSHKNGLHAYYLLLSFFWILNIIDILIPTFLVQYQTLIYLASAGIFLIISYKVIRNLGK